MYTKSNLAQSFIIITFNFLMCQNPTIERFKKLKKFSSIPHLKNLLKFYLMSKLQLEVLTNGELTNTINIKLN
jgi:hypothetical protein